MNILIWNCRGSLNPNFRSIVNGMVNSYSPTIMIISEKKPMAREPKELLIDYPLMWLFLLTPLVWLGGYGFYGTLLKWI